MKLESEERVEVLAAMKDVEQNGLVVARHVRGDIYEVRASGKDVIYRVFFATEGRFSHVLLALEAFTKKTQKAPKAKIELAEKRLADWRGRAK